MPFAVIGAKKTTKTSTFYCKCGKYYVEGK